MAAFELGRRVHFSKKEKPSYDLKRISDVATLFRREFGEGVPEKFVVFYISRQFQLLGQKLISQGGSSETIVDPRIVFKEALLLDASAIILAHNHPSNDLVPSKQDLSLTKEMVQAGQLFRIPVAEHVIVTATGEIGIIDQI